MRDFLEIYLIIGYAIDITYQINCVREFEENPKYVYEEFGPYTVRVKVGFDYIGTILKGYIIMLFWPIAIMKM